VTDVTEKEERMSIADLARPSLVEPGAAPIVERLLRDRESVWRQVKSGHDLDRLIRQLFATSAVALAGYGLVIGISHSPQQAISSAIKLPLLYLLTLAICLPTFYLFNLLYGGRLSARQAMALALAAITVMAALTLAFAPISVFFLVSARDYAFFKLLNVGILAFTGATGLAFLGHGMRTMNAPEADEFASLAEAATEEEGDGSRPFWRRRPGLVNMPLLIAWLILFGFVGTQLGWTLGPFFGDPGLEFRLFRSTEGNFYLDIAQSLARVIRLAR
jgi:hypothetical protein